MTAPSLWRRRGSVISTHFSARCWPGLIAVPLSVPLGGAVDERVKSVLLDAAPSVVLTTSDVAGDVAEYLKSQPDGPAPSLVEVDLVDLEARGSFRPGRDTRTDTAYLQYTSGSTRAPAGVEVTYRNLMANFEQMFADYFADTGGVSPPDTTFVSWLPFYHDMGLLVGVCMPLLAGYHAVLTSPVSFLARPARWLQMLANNPHTFSAGPNFAFEVAARKTSDEDLAGIDLSGVLGIINGSERVQPATLKRFTDRFAPVQVSRHGAAPLLRDGRSDGVYRDPRARGAAHRSLRFRRPGRRPCASRAKVRMAQHLSVTACRARQFCGSLIRTPASNARRKPSVRYGFTATMSPPVTGASLRRASTLSAAKLSSPSPGTPEGRGCEPAIWASFTKSELFIIGRIKDLLIVYGRNHSPDDIEATIQLITRGRCVAISVPDDGIEKLVAIAELKNRGGGAEILEQFAAVKNDVTSAISTSHGLSIADLVLVPQGSIPLTTSGKVRRRSCVELYQQDQFARLDA